MQVAISAILNCLFAGSILLFSVYIPAFRHQGLSGLQINSISTAGELGMYFTVPAFGMAGDHFGPATISWLGGVLFFVGYLFAALWPYNQLVLIFAFFCVGAATTSLYLSGVITFARRYAHYRSKYRGFALSIPTACFGLSAVLLSRISELPYFRNDQGLLSLSKLFFFFSFLLLAVGLLGGLLIRIPEPSALPEEDRLLTQTDMARHPLIRLGMDWRAYLFGFAILFTLGPLEMFLNNMSAILEGGSIAPTDAVSMFATVSTITRLITGLFSDILFSWSISRMWLVLVFAFTALTGHMLLAENLGPEYPATIASMMGFAYGGIFTLCPAIVVIVWGVESFGTVWGMFASVVAIASVIYSLLYGWLFDSSTLSTTIMFYITSISSVLSIGLWIGSWIGWRQNSSTSRP
ncbi:hypothetical protein CANCADRAFT_147902 [Tortispora caseinolytica NRRL Y-17796]|uniref:Probable transporter MCH1 n=1 Tax=Tortispora caseinolytica NRRL Y-17796 TaxID=767744 RepID=A0A1E4TEJ0_9ASCO|nr:hypothetical protein CANCADRAFT_147902 [Tortispora caseinolytica NRRL Y-17796]